MRPRFRADVLVIVVLGLLLGVCAVLRQEFIGDGIRHMTGAIELARPPIGAPRWLLFPAFAWTLVHPFAIADLIVDVDAAIHLILAVSVIAAIGYLYALNVWLQSERCSPVARASALMMAGATAPFLILYSDVAEVQLPAAIAVAALAACRSRFAEERGGDRTVLATIGAIAMASLLYQAMFLALLFLPLAAPTGVLRRRQVWLPAIAIAMTAPVVMVLARIFAGDPAGIAIATTLQGERGEVIRASLGSRSPLKFAAALIAGPPQALVGLWKFQGLALLAGGLRSLDIDALTNAGRLVAGLIFGAILAFAVIRTRDWRLATAALGVLALPMLRNQQYTYVKFYLLWPVLVALASTKLRPALAVSLAMIMLALNSTMLARGIAEGRARFADAHRAYASASPSECFLTTGWGPPFGHRWPGATVPIISLLWANDEETITRDDITAAVTSCFCRSTRVWTDATSDAAGEVKQLTSRFGYRELPLDNFLLQPGDGSAVPGDSIEMFVYPVERQAEICGLIRTGIRDQGLGGNQKARRRSTS